MSNVNKGKESKLKFYLDDKGRKVYYFDENKNEIDKDKDGFINENNNLDKADNNEDLQLIEEINNKKSKLVSEFINSDTLNNFQNKRDLNLKRGVFFCDICNIESKDSRSYIEHLNGKAHYSKLGINMKVMNIGVEKVKEKLKLLSRKSDLTIIKDKIKYLENK